jgi:undecaprenyl-diphosphatase
MNAFDAAVERAAGQVQQPAVSSALEAATHLGDGWVVATAAAAAAAVFLALRSPRAAALLTAAAVLAFLTTNTAKVLIGRDRPEVAWRAVALPESPSFPSGHSLESAAVYGALGLLTARRLRRRASRAGAAAGGFLLAALVGVSRVYLGVHYATDVLAGWGAGTGLALAAWWIDGRRRAGARAAPP